ncbi:MAG: 3-hydroxybutyryl-CoA dehydrogenase [Steroidobacteraceae bacterium]
MRADSTAVIGAGRMGRGIAQTLAFAGLRTTIVDLKRRTDEEFNKLKASACSDIETDLRFLASLGVGTESAVRSIMDLITIAPCQHAAVGFGDHQLVFEAVPETLEAKRAAFAWVSAHANPDAIIASTTSTLSVDELAAMVAKPQRFVNAHWLNPPHLMPLVEIARGTATSQEAVDRLVAVLKAAGKVPVVMTSAPGYVVPRIQALALSESVRLYAEGVASAEDIDKAIRIGFGVRFAVLGMLEFIDFGGNDILYYGVSHLARTVDEHRFAVPQLAIENMHAGRNGIRDGVGYYDWANIDIAAYRRERLAKLVDLLRFMDLLPKAAG